LYELVDRVLVGDVGFHAERLAALPFDQLRGLDRVLTDDVAHHDRSAFRRQPPRGLRADAATSARNDRDLAFEPLHGTLPR
jgi:hypothetical protein